jgi:hypothetical protein
MLMMLTVKIDLLGCDMAIHDCECRVGEGSINFASYTEVDFARTVPATLQSPETKSKVQSMSLESDGNTGLDLQG